MVTSPKNTSCCEFPARTRVGFCCGSGALADFVDKASYLGFDRDADTIAIARKSYPEHQFVSELPDHTTQFETVVCLAVLEHVPDPTDFLATLASYVTPTGNIVLTTPHPRFEWVHTAGSAVGLFSHDAHEEHETLLDEAALTHVSREAGLNMFTYKRFLFGANQLAVLRRT